MEARLHAVLATGILTLFNTLFINVSNALLLGAMTAIITNALLDGLGTEREDENNYYTTADTHTLPRALFLGAITGLANTLLLTMLTGLALWHIIFLAIAGGIIASLMHLTLDVLTGDAVYVKRDGKWQKIILVRRKIQSLRGAIMLISLIMLIIAFKIY
ncbi:MAG: DUF1286 domain-containing protein [Candidatus Aenigmatarchaeota archaeon]